MIDTEPQIPKEDYFYVLGQVSGIFIKKIAEGSAADRNGNVKVNDQIIEVRRKHYNPRAQFHKALRFVLRRVFIIFIVICFMTITLCLAIKIDMLLRSILDLCEMDPRSQSISKLFTKVVLRENKLIQMGGRK